MSYTAESRSLSIDLVPEDQRDAVENILNTVREACLRVAPLNEVQSAIVDARSCIIDILDMVPSSIENILNLYRDLIEAIYAQRDTIMRSIGNGFPLDSPNFIESHIRLLIASKFELNEGEIQMLEKHLRENISGRASGKRRKGRKVL